MARTHGGWAVSGWGRRIITHKPPTLAKTLILVASALCNLPVQISFANSLSFNAPGNAKTMRWPVSSNLICQVLVAKLELQRW